MAAKTTSLNKRAAKWKRDPFAFITEVLRNPEDGKPFELYSAEVEFVRRSYTDPRRTFAVLGTLLFGTKEIRQDGTGRNVCNLRGGGHRRSFC